ncbi:bypass of stop codon 6 [Fusarium globosum]|uniref:Bypass of stop codon 6 n=1 Tax=Fusarium globosum TaxID=78864 RepID=A0A8H5YTT4_9HYPO|nr:bypass of stop codon 6 [Fusarium globosum]
MFLISRIEQSFKIAPRLSEVLDQHVFALNGVAKVCHCVLQELVFRSQGFVLNLDNAYPAFDGFRFGDRVIACLFHLFISTAADTMRPGLYSCEPCLRKAMDWYPIETSLKQLPGICIDEEGFDRENFFCNVCEEYSVDFDDDYGGCDGDTQRMGSLLERFIKHARDNCHITKEAYDSDPKTIQLREMASRAIASHSNRSDADTMKDHRAEHKRAVATNTLSTLIDISNSLRVIAQCTLHTSGLDLTKLIEMPARCGPEEMPEECLWKFPLDENEDEEN